MASKRKSKDKKLDEPLDMDDGLEPEPVDLEAAPEPEPEPAPVPAPEVAPEPEPIPESDPHPGLPRIQLRVFLKLAGLKPDQLAGFKRYAEAEGLGPMPVPAWREAHKAFRTKPTKVQRKL